MDLWVHGGGGKTVGVWLRSGRDRPNNQPKRLAQRAPPGSEPIEVSLCLALVLREHADTRTTAMQQAGRIAQEPIPRRQSREAAAKMWTSALHTAQDATREGRSPAR